MSLVISQVRTALGNSMSSAFAPLQHSPHRVLEGNILESVNARESDN